MELRFYENGKALGEWPRAVVEATADYREDIDPLEAVFEAGVFVEDANARTPTADLYAAYIAWAEKHLPALQPRFGQDGFGKALGGRFPRYRTKAVRGFVGVRVTTPGDTGDTESTNPPPREASGSELVKVTPNVSPEPTVSDATHWSD